MRNITVAASCLSLLLVCAAPASANEPLSKQGITANHATDISARKKKKSKMMRSGGMSNGMQQDNGMQGGGMQQGGAMQGGGMSGGGMQGGRMQRQGM